MKVKNLLLALFVITSFTVRGQYYDWGKNIGGPGTTYGQGNVTRTDAAGNIYQAGIFQGTLDFDPGSGITNLTSAGPSGYDDFFFAKYDSAGNMIWAKRIGSADDDFVLAMQVDNSGNIYLTGGFSNTVDFDPDSGSFQLVSNSFYINPFFAKYNTSGNLIWAKHLEGTDHASCNSLTVDATGYIYVMGIFMGTLDFDPGPGKDSINCPGKDIFYAKYDPSGNLVWNKTISNAYAAGVFNVGEAIEVDASGNVYVAGSFRDSLDFDPETPEYILYATDSADLFFAKYNPSGNLLWAKTLDADFEYGNGDMNVDPAGNVFLFGRYLGVTDFDAGAGVTTLTGDNAFLLKYTNAGNFDWVKQIGANNDYEEIIASYLDNLENIYIFGFFSGTTDFDPDTSTYDLINMNSNSRDAFFARYSSQGDFVWAKSITGTDYITPDDVHVDDAYNIYLTGAFRGTYDFDPSVDTNNITCINAGYGDIFFAKYSQDICSQGALTFINPSDITCTSNGGVTASLTGAPLPYTYQWNTTPVTNSAILDVSDAGIYTVTVTDSNNCVYSHGVLINSPAPGEFDMNANLTTTVFRTGFPSTIWLDGFNSGCAPQSGLLKLVLDTMLIYNSAIPTPDAILGDTLSWNFSNLTYDSLHLTPQVLVTTPIFAAVGDTIHLEIKISSFPGEADLTNNFKTYDYPVVNSFDPNDKQVYPRGEGVTGNIVNNQKMTYTIRFQNTGNADAINIYILDQLDADLDLSTLKVIGTSHEMTTEILPFNVLKFKFDNINLADSFSNEPLSHGYVMYEVEQIPNLPLGTQIINSAEIYFDFNSPIYTNTVLNTIYSPVGIKETAQKSEFIIYPNPTSGLFTLQLKAKNEGGSMITIRDIYGRAIYKALLKDQIQQDINLEGLAKGIYFIEIHGSVQKLVVQ